MSFDIKSQKFLLMKLCIYVRVAICFVDKYRYFPGNLKETRIFSFSASEI